MPPPPPPHITDYMRILMGDVPWSFLLECSLRLVAMYLLLLTGLRLMGKRQAGQVSRTELAGLVSIAVSIGERLLQGTVTTVLVDGVLQLPIMERVVLSRERLFAQLRGESIEHLGQVKRLYMEANGTFSMVEAEAPAPGLSVIPGWDEGFRQLQPVAAGKFACVACGKVLDAPQKPTENCSHCGAHEWHPAVEVLK